MPLLICEDHDDGDVHCYGNGYYGDDDDIHDDDNMTNVGSCLCHCLSVRTGQWLNLNPQVQVWASGARCHIRATSSSRLTLKAAEPGRLSPGFPRSPIECERVKDTSGFNSEAPSLLAILPEVETEDGQAYIPG